MNFSIQAIKGGHAVSAGANPSIRPLLILGVFAFFAGLFGVWAALHDNPGFERMSGAGIRAVGFWIAATATLLGLITVLHESLRDKNWDKQVLLFGIGALLFSMMLVNIGVLIGGPLRTEFTEFGMSGVAPSAVCILYGILKRSEWTRMVKIIAYTGLIMAIVPIVLFFAIPNGSCRGLLWDPLETSMTFACFRYFNSSMLIVYFLWFFVVTPFVLAWGLGKSLNKTLQTRK